MAAFLFPKLNILQEVETDAGGISSSSFRKIMEEWPANKPKPKVLYTVPVSQTKGPRPRQGAQFPI